MLASAFASLVKQEVAYFDKRSVGKITSQLQDDAARLHTFTGEPIRSFLIAVSSLFTGLILSFVVRNACIDSVSFTSGDDMLNSCFLFTRPTVHVAFCTSSFGMCALDGIRNIHGDEDIPRGGYGQRFCRRA